MRYPGAHWYPSTIHHPTRSQTRGVVEHETFGHQSGDLSVLRGPSVDVHFYVTKRGEVFQLLDSESMAYHAFATANDTCIGIEHETSGEPFTRAQLRASARLNAWIVHHHHGIRIAHVHPKSSADGRGWHGLFDHKDLTAAHIDGNNHGDGIPTGTGWPRFLKAVKRNGQVRKLLPLWTLIEAGHVAWQRRIKKPPAWVTEIPRFELDAQLVRHK